MAISSGELNREYANRANALGLSWECLGDGDTNSEIVVIAEAPGPRECEMHIPLVGGSGKFLWQALSKFNIRRQHCYITNVVKHQLVNDDGTKDGVSKNELSHWKALLNWELSQLPNAKYILLLGNYALDALIGVTGIDKWRGSVIQQDDVSYIIANNPAHILRKPSLEPIFYLDCSKLQQVRDGTWQEYNIQHLYDPSYKEAIAWCDKMIQENAPVSVDIETISGETACVGLANEAHKGMCINFRGKDDNRYSIREEAALRIAIQRVLRHNKVKLVAQNGGFDCGWLWFKDRIKSKPLWVDTLLAHHTLHPTWPHNLGFLTAQYTTHPFYKDDSKEWREGGDISSFWMYNVKDACITWEVARKLEQELIEQKLWDFFRNHVMRLQPHLIASTVLGNKIDLAMREKLNKDYAAEVARLSAEFVAQAQTLLNDPDYTCNPLSNKQVVDLLFTRLRLIGRHVGNTKENRTYIIESGRATEPQRQLLQTLNEFKEQHKLYSTYITAKADEDNRMRSDYKQYGTQYVPGRLSSAQTLWGSGMNLQNQPERLHGMFIADTLEIKE